MRPLFETAPRLAAALLLLATTLAACDSATTPDPASDVPVAALSLATAGVGGSDMVPFRVRATFGTAAGATPITCAPTQAGVTVPADKFAGTGNVTHAGKSSIAIIFDACTLILPPGGSAAWTAQGHSTLTAAKGDLIFVTFTMTQFVNGDFVLDSFAITGGTGRFENATGSMSGSGWIDLATLEGYFDFSGLITRPNS